MLEVGNGALTAAEYRTNFAFWAAMKSPLLIGTNLAKLSSANLAIIKNSYLIAFNQDATYGKPATPYKWGYVADWTFNAAHPAEYWSGQSSNGVLVLMMNTGSATATRTATWSEVPQLKGTSYEVTDIWTGSSLGCVKTGISRSLVSHDTAGFLVGKAC
jgi:alpha-galactosidase